MKRTHLLLFTALTAAAALTGCQKSGEDYSKYVKLGDYKDLTVERVKTIITDADVAEEIQNDLYYSADQIEVTDRAAKSGDIVNVDFDGTIDGEPFEGGSAEGYEYELGADEMVDGFDENLIGKKTGDTVTFEVTFPTPYDGENDGKTAEFTVTLNAVYELQLPEYNDAYVKENYEYDTTAEYEEYLKSELQASYDEDSDYMALSDALSQIVSDASFNGYPEDLYASCKATVEEENASFAEQLGMDIEDFLGEDYDIDLDVLNIVNERLVIYAIAQQEKITVSDDDLKEYAESAYEFYDAENADAFLESYGAENVKYDLLYNDVMDFLRENTHFVDVEDTEEDGSFTFDAEDDEDIDAGDDTEDDEDIDAADNTEDTTEES